MPQSFIETEERKSEFDSRLDPSFFTKTALTKNKPVDRIKPTMSQYLTLGDVWMYDTKTEQWTRGDRKDFGPSSRWMHTSVMMGTKMIVFGGCKGNLILSNEIWEYDTVGMSWKKGGKS